MRLSLNDKIITGILEGRDREVLNLLYEKFLPKLKGYILKNRGTADDVKDLFQDVLFIIYRKIKLEGFLPEGDLLNYMFIMAKNSWIKKAVKNQLNNSIDDTVKQFSSSDTGALSSLIVEEKGRAAIEILETLGDQCAELLNLRIYEELDLNEIAIKMGFSNTNVVKSTIYRCKQKLKEKIKKNKGFQDLIGIKLS